MGAQATFWFMVLMHLVADYTLQGWLENGKQVSWWRDLFKGSKLDKYRHDYIVALACHSFYWSIMVCSPFYADPLFSLMVVSHATIHGVVDDMKANRGILNLVQDQAIHLIQIVMIYVWGIFSEAV